MYINNYFRLRWGFFGIKCPNLFNGLSVDASIDPLHDDAKNQNKPGALCIVGFIGGPLSDNTVIIPPLNVNVPDLFRLIEPFVNI